MVIVLLVIGILMAATMRFGSGRIVDLKAQSIKEQFVGYYNDLYSQNMTSSFRDKQKYQTLTVVLTTGIYYLLDTIAKMDTRLPHMEIKNLRFVTGGVSFPAANLLFVPYHFWCTITNGSDTWAMLYFDFFVPENGKQYCFEIKSETCKLIEQRCVD